MAAHPQQHVYEFTPKKDDAFACRGYMAYGGQMFSVSMLVRKSGHVEMLEEDRMEFYHPA